MPLFIIISVALSVEKIKGVISKVIAYLFLNGHWQTNSASCFSLRLLSLPENHSWVNLHTHTHTPCWQEKKYIKQSPFSLLLLSLQISLIPMTAHEIKPLWPHWRKGTHSTMPGTHMLSYSTSWQAGDEQELEKSESYKCPGCSLHAAQAGAAVWLLGKGKQANSFYWDLTSSRLRGISDFRPQHAPILTRGELPSRDFSGVQKHTSPQTSPTAALTLSGLWQQIPFVMALLAQCSEQGEQLSLCKERCFKAERKTNADISLSEPSRLLRASWSYRHLQEEALCPCSRWACGGWCIPGGGRAGCGVGAERDSCPTLPRLGSLAKWHGALYDVLKIAVHFYGGADEWMRLSKSSLHSGWKPQHTKGIPWHTCACASQNLFTDHFCQEMQFWQN